MYLHRDRETFRDIVEQAADSSGRTPAVVEKDYYVTLILKLLSEQLDKCVFPWTRLWLLWRNVCGNNEFL